MENLVYKFAVTNRVISAISKAASIIQVKGFETREHLTTVLLHIKDGGLTVVSTDARVMYVSDIFKIDCSSLGDREYKFMIPVRDAKVIAKLKAKNYYIAIRQKVKTESHEVYQRDFDEDQYFTISYGSNSYECTLYSDRHYPDYLSVVPVNPYSFVFSLKQMTLCIDKALNTCPDIKLYRKGMKEGFTHFQINFSILKNKNKLALNSCWMGDVNSEAKTLEIRDLNIVNDAWNPDNILCYHFSFSPLVLAKALNLLDVSGPDLIRCEFSNGGRSFLFTPANNYNTEFVWVMPLDTKILWDYIRLIHPNK